MNYPARANPEPIILEQTRAGWGQDSQSESLSLSSGAWLTTALTLVGFALSALTVNEIVDWTLRREIYDKQLSAPNALLASIRTEEAKRLSQYRWVRKSDGILRIPVERAKQLVILDYAQTRGETLPQPSTSGGKL